LTGAESSTADLSPAEQKKKERRERIRKEGGRFAFDTKYGALNPYAIYYGLVSIFLGIPWYLALTTYQFFQFVTRGRFDKQRIIPVFISQVWGTWLMHLTRCFPKIENRDILSNFYKE
jgi:hypothetical protein